MNNFSGKDVSREHIGDRQSDSLSAMIDNLDTEDVDFTFTVGAEAADIIPVTVQATSRGGKAIAKAIRVHARVYDADMIGALAAAAEVAASGGAALVTGANQAAALIDLGSDGAGIISVEDASTVLAGDLILAISPADRAGVTRFVTLTYA